MAIGTCKFCRQVGGRGAYAYVQLSVESSDEPVEIDMSAVSDQSKFLIPALKTGVDFAWESTLQRRVDAATPFQRVKILEVKYAPADSARVMFVYAAAMAFCDALGLKLDVPIKVDPESNTRYFCFQS